MENILITGAGGNVGSEVLKHFIPSADQKVWTTTRGQSSREKSLLYFDFKFLEGSTSSLNGIDVLFLLRPPDISNVRKYFVPLIKVCKEKHVKHIVFLSVQGADKASYIPHAKIEKLIVESGISYTFIRPGYFMQNLTTTLLGDLRSKRRIFLPAGKAPFLWVDVEDVGRATASVLSNVAHHRNKIYTITGNNLISFNAVAELMSYELNEKIKYISPGLLRFYVAKRRQGLDSAYILVMILLHYFRRFQKSPMIHTDFKLLTGRNPVTLKGFIARNKHVWIRK